MNVQQIQQLSSWVSQGQRTGAGLAAGRNWREGKGSEMFWTFLTFLICSYIYIHTYIYIYYIIIYKIIYIYILFRHSAGWCCCQCFSSRISWRRFWLSSALPSWTWGSRWKHNTSPWEVTQLAMWFKLCKQYLIGMAFRFCLHMQGQVKAKL